MHVHTHALAAAAQAAYGSQLTKPPNTAHVPTACPTHLHLLQPQRGTAQHAPPQAAGLLLPLPPLLLLVAHAAAGRAPQVRVSRRRARAVASRPQLAGLQGPGTERLHHTLPPGGVAGGREAEVDALPLPELLGDLRGVQFRWAARAAGRAVCCWACVSVWGNTHRAMEAPVRQCIGRAAATLHAANSPIWLQARQALL